MVLSYTTPKRDRPIVEIPFVLDGEQFLARRPKESVLIYLQAARANAATTADKLHATMAFLDGCLTPAAQQRIQARLRDWDDPLELTDLVDLMTDVSAKLGEADEAEAAGKATAIRAGKGHRVITPDGADAEVIEPAPDAPNRAARRAAPAKAAKAAVARKQPAKTTARGRALPR